MKIYETWNEDNTELLNSITDPDATTLEKMLRHTGKWLLVVTPTPDPATEKLGEKTFTATERSWEVVDKTQEEKDAYIVEQAAAAQTTADAQEVADEILASPLDGLSFTKVGIYIDDTVTDLASAKVVLKKLAKAILILNKRLGI